MDGSGQINAEELGIAFAHLGIEVMCSMWRAVCVYSACWSGHTAGAAAFDKKMRQQQHWSHQYNRLSGPATLSISPPPPLLLIPSTQLLLNSVDVEKSAKFGPMTKTDKSQKP